MRTRERMRRGDRYPCAPRAVGATILYGTRYDFVERRRARYSFSLDYRERRYCALPRYLYSYLLPFPSAASSASAGASSFSFPSAAAFSSSPATSDGVFPPRGARGERGHVVSRAAAFGPTAAIGDGPDEHPLHGRVQGSTRLCVRALHGARQIRHPRVPHVLQPHPDVHGKRVARV